MAFPKFRDVQHAPFLLGLRPAEDGEVLSLPPDRKLDVHRWRSRNSCWWCCHLGARLWRDARSPDAVGLLERFQLSAEPTRGD